MSSFEVSSRGGQCLWPVPVVGSISGQADYLMFNDSDVGQLIGWLCMLVWLWSCWEPPSLVPQAFW